MVALDGDDAGEHTGPARVECAGDTVHGVERRHAAERLDEDVDDSLAAQATAEDDVALGRGVIADDRRAAGGEGF